MIRQFTFAFILVQVAMTTALATEVYLSTAAGAHKSDMSLMRYPVDDEGCAKATWPNIPERCLQRTAPKAVTLVLSQNQ